MAGFSKSSPRGPVSSTVWWFVCSNTGDFTNLLTTKFQWVSLGDLQTCAGHWPANSGDKDGDGVLWDM